MPQLTDEQADALLDQGYSKHSDARYLLKEAFDMGVAADPWTPVTVRMPPPDADLLVVWGSDKRVYTANTFTKYRHPLNPLGYLIQGHPGSHNDVTHWMFKPKPPGN